MNVIMLVVLVFLVMIVVAFLLNAVVILRPYEAGVVEFLGKYRRTLPAGLHLVIPMMERVIRVDLRESVVDVPPQEVITKDNVVVTVDGIIYYRVIKPEDVVYKVQDFEIAAVALAQTNLRNIIGELTLDETLTSREIINTRLRTVLDEVTDAWGVKVTRVELKRIDPPRDVMEAMHKQMKAEREKRAMILEAEGYRESQIKRAEGEKQAKILEAEGEARSIQLVADAEKYRKIAEAEGQREALRLVLEIIKEVKPTPEVLALQYYEALKAIAQGEANKVFIPVELSALASALGVGTDLLASRKPDVRG